MGIEAKIFEEDLRCATIDVRAYLLPNDSSKFAIEFQRNSGDSFAFANTYQEVKCHFQQESLPLLENEGTTTNTSNDLEAIELPALDFLDDVPMPFELSPEEEAEQKERVVELAKDPANHTEAGLLLKDMPFPATKKCWDTLRNLLSSPHISTTFPAAKVCEQLAMSDARNLLDEGILTLLLHKLEEDNVLLQRECSIVLKSAADNLRLTDPNELNIEKLKDVYNSLFQILNGKVQKTADKVVSNNLEDTYQNLQPLTFAY